ncbi:hypothetical protein B0H14DRAFT_3438706 [Mycena olivaceomarginata]|nr:hypothetical protein B0H14DRAFT_3438706 [Mycena olivaceomarginata]
MTPPRPRSPSVSSDDGDAQYFCSFCDTCPTCGTDPDHMPVPHRDQAIPLPAVRERILPDIPIALPFTLFILEAYVHGGWLHLVIPYALCMLVYFL